MSKHIYESAIREKIASESTDSKPQLQRFSGQLFETISQGLLEDGHVRIHQFGSFKLNWANQRKGRNPQTGESIIIAAQPRVSFTPAKALKEQVNAAIPDQIMVDKPLSETAPGFEHKTKTRPVQQSQVITGKVVAQTPTAAPATEQDHIVIKRSSTVLNRNSALAASIIITVITALVFLAFSDQVSNQAPQTAQLNEADNSQAATPRQQIESDSKLVQASNWPEQQSIKTAPKASTTPYFKSRSHKLTDGDSLWRLSRKHYLNPLYWPHIYQANLSQIDNPNKLVMGRTIHLPTMSGSPNNLTAEDRRNIAEGYFLVYRYYKKTGKAFPYYALLGIYKFDPAVIQEHIYEIDEQDWHSLQLASN